MAGRTLYDKIWETHTVGILPTGQTQLFIGLHLIHEVTSPQAFDGLRMAGRPLRRPDLTIATEDHNTPTLDIDKPIADPVSRTQVETLRRNCAEFGVPLHPLGDADDLLREDWVPQIPGITCAGSYDDYASNPGKWIYGQNA